MLRFYAPHSFITRPTGPWIKKARPRTYHIIFHSRPNAFESMVVFRPRPDINKHVQNRLSHDTG